MLGIAIHNGSQFRQGLVFSKHNLQELEGAKDAVASGIVIEKNDVAGLFTAQVKATSSHSFHHITVTHRSPLKTSAQGLEGYL